MLTVKILAQPLTRFFSDLHPFYRWKCELKDSGMKISFHFNHLDNELLEADTLIIFSRYFDKGWQNIERRTGENETELFDFLIKLKRNVGKIVWFDEADSTGSSDFSLINLVDVFVKKQILKDLSYYSLQDGSRDLRIWLNRNSDTSCVTFNPCPREQLHKIKAGWSIGFNDYRFFLPKTRRLSNYLSYRWHPLNFTSANVYRPVDLTFRGRVKEESTVGYQRNKILILLSKVNFNVISGSRIAKTKYIRELRQSKVSISPYGYGEICFRDFESFVAGTLLIKPNMDHVVCFPDVFKPYETYIPISWELDDLEGKLDDVLDNFADYQQIAINGQNNYKKLINDPLTFVSRVREVVIEN